MFLLLICENSSPRANLTGRLLDIDQNSKKRNSKTLSPCRNNEDFFYFTNNLLDFKGARVTWRKSKQKKKHKSYAWKRLFSGQIGWDVFQTFASVLSSKLTYETSVSSFSTFFAIYKHALTRYERWIELGGSGIKKKDSPLPPNWINTCY